MVGRGVRGTKPPANPGGVLEQEEADAQEDLVAVGQPRRDGNGRWLPGETGNPAGRPVILAGVRELARRHTVVAVRALVDVAIDAAAPPAARVAAARELLDRGHGRPRPEGDKPPLEQMTDEELADELEFDAGAYEAAAVLGISLGDEGDGDGDPLPDDEAQGA